MAYPAEKQHPAPSADELRARIPGWGADLDPANRPSFPRERRDLDSGAHWDLPESQPQTGPRERSIEHKSMTPVFGTAQPLKGFSGVIRGYAYRRFSEGRAAHWLLLILGDRVDAIESHLASFATTRPDNPITETGILSEFRRHPISSRYGRNRVDVNHTWLDPIIVAGPWVLAGVVGFKIVRRLLRR